MDKEAKCINQLVFVVKTKLKYQPNQVLAALLIVMASY